MKQTTPDEQQLIEWATETIQSLQGQNWQLTLDGGLGVVNTTLKVTESHTEVSPGNSETVSRVEKRRFKISSWGRKTGFSTD